MKLLITGADGFVGKWLVRAARAAGHDVIASVLPDAPPPAEWHRAPGVSPVEVVRADFREWDQVAALAELSVDAVVHLAAVASAAEARRDPDAAYMVNGGMTAFFGGELARKATPPRFLYVSSGEVYGAGHVGAIAETAERRPASPYAISKAGGEIPLEGFWQESQFPAIIARPFTHTGPGQAPVYVLPALATRLLEAKRTGASTVKTGNLAPVRDFLDVRDVVRAYLLLLEHGVPGEVYNVASGVGRGLADCFRALANLVGVDATAEQDAALLRPDDIPVLIGDPTKIRQATGWTPTIPFDRTLQDLVDAQAH